ncbi:MAG: hypothetical protein ACE5J7_01440 [Candidatus Aenigmatarchaeota archaeon]
MPDYILKTDVLAPEEDISREFEGHHPTRLFGVMNEKIRMIFKVGAANFFEDKVKWDKLGDPIEFFGQWRGKAGKDSLTTFWIKVVIQGRQNIKDKSGYVKVKIKPWLETKIPYSTALDKTLKVANMKTFYLKQIRSYVEEAKRQTENFDREIREMFEAELVEEV